MFAVTIVVGLAMTYFGFTLLLSGQWFGLVLMFLGIVKIIAVGELTTASPSKKTRKKKTKCLTCEGSGVVTGFNKSQRYCTHCKGKGKV